MTRPWLIWLLSLVCAAGIFGAMGVITHRSLNLEREWAQARADAELQERLRLALWRMETEASSLMIEENNRPPEHFRREKAGLAASPVGTAVPKHVRLHFEIAPDRTVMSPQVPRAGDPQYQVAEKNLTRLRELLARPAGAAICSCVTPSVAAPEARLLSNATFIDAAARNKGPFEWSGPPSQNDAYLDAAQTMVLNSGAQQGTIMEAPAVEAMKQSALNNLEMNRRAQVYTKKVEEKNSMQGQEKSSSSAPPAKEKQGKPTPKPSTPSSKKAPPAPAPIATSQANAGSQALTSKDQAPVPPGSLEGDTASQKTAEVAPQQRVTPFSPFWLENELFLVREVFASGKRHVQGVWLDADSLKASLLEAVLDLLPQAALLPVASVRFAPAADARLVSTPVISSGDPMDLIGLPWKLMPGIKPVAVVQGWTPMRLTLAAAWFGALLAVVAAAALLFGVTRLSERRAAFVSSVTHELRTPLTTFRLYSELLEQGMVREEADRTQYLHTLRTEAERLTHLVDNVLAYSRIERTHRRSRMEHLELTSWMERTRGRLEDRVREAGMNLHVSLPATGVKLACVTDATALEQIVFNLVDNACKYAAGRCTEPVVRLTLEHAGRWVTLRVCDSGPGISRRERSRLFRPFHKSADEAANSKPGVGLGLALCHRLAKALGGKLSLERPEGPAAGACFVLRLPGA